MLTQHDLDAAALEAEAVILEWEQRFQALFNAPDEQAANMQAYLSNPGEVAASDRMKRQAKWLQSKVKKMPVTPPMGAPAGGNNATQI